MQEAELLPLEQQGIEFTPQRLVQGEEWGFKVQLLGETLGCACTIPALQGVPEERFQHLLSQAQTARLFCDDPGVDLPLQKRARVEGDSVPERFRMTLSPHGMEDRPVA